MIVKGLEPCFTGREPHTDVSFIDLLKKCQILFTVIIWRASRTLRCTVKRAHAPPPLCN